MLATRLGALGGVPTQTWVDGVPHLRASVPGEGPVVAVVGHADTVFAAGTAARRPMAITGSRMEGPGTADMKGGLASAVAVISALRDLGVAHPHLEVLVYGDEETRHVAPPDLGSPAPAACLVLECGRPGGGFVTSRKAGAWVTLTATGAAAHAGVDPDRGRNAIVALAAAVVGVGDLHRSRPGLSASVGRIEGGTAVNAVPAAAQAQVDVRATTTADLDRALADIRARLRDGPRPEGTTVEVGAVQRWPAMQPLPSLDLTTPYQRACASVGLPAHPVATGGTSDGAWFAAGGVPTLDGLGPIGGSDHSPQEHLDLDSVGPRAGALAGLLHHLSAGA